MNYTKGNYFGELSLLRAQSRAENVKAKTDVKLLALNRNLLKKMLGPIDIILKRSIRSMLIIINKYMYLGIILIKVFIIICFFMF